MTGHPVIAELMAGEGFDWICVDMEHTATDYASFQSVAQALGRYDCDLLARLQDCDPVQAKRVLDAGADGIIVPMVNTAEQARRAVAMAKFPPDGIRGVAFSRASDYGRGFQEYVRDHNANVIVAVMLEHIEGVRNADAILSTSGVDAAFIGPYDLSCSMGLPGQLDHPEVISAQAEILAACLRHGVAPGLHVVQVAPERIRRSIEQGFRFIACGLDTEFIIHSSRAILEGNRDNG